MLVDKDECSGRENEDIKSITERYAEYLSKLNRHDLEAELESFRLNLASKGIFISIRILDHEEKAQTSIQGP